MECFLHIGTEKTATTTIQSFLSINRQKLLNNGYIYTTANGENSNRTLAVAAYNPDRRDDFTKALRLTSHSEVIEFRSKFIAGLSRELLDISQIAKKVIFSSEHFQSRLTDPIEIQRLKKILTEIGIEKVYVIVYLRRPAEIANSLYSTAIKAGRTIEVPPSPNQPYWHNICHHQNTLEKFGLVFGKKNVIPRLFNPKEFINNSIIDDFLNVIGIQGSKNFSVPTNANESLSPTGVHILRRLNHTIPAWIGNRPNPFRENLVSYIQNHFSDSKYVMPEELFKQYDLEFKASNEWVRTMYFPHKAPLFSDSLPKSSAPTISEKDLDRMAALITDIWHDKQKDFLKTK